MKNYLILTLLFSCISYSQETATTESGKKVHLNKNGTYKVISNEVTYSLLNKDDFKEQNQRMGAYNLNRLIINGDNKLSDVIIGVGMPIDIFKNIDISKVEKMIKIANEKSIEKTKNKYTYVAKIIKISYTDNKKWSCTIEFTAQNDFGATKDAISFVTFNELGGFENIVIQ
jgi:hypothetical protein